MKEIKKEELELLIEKKIIRNSTKGFVDKYGNAICFYRTRNKRYIEDKYSEIVQKLI